MFYKLKRMHESTLQNILLAGLGLVGVEIVNDASIQEWVKIFLQTAITFATLYKVFKREKEKE